jgi:4-hydroxybenzoate polyprenyltransferase
MSQREQPLASGAAPLVPESEAIARHSTVAGRPSVVRQLPYTVVAMRPKQWTKNGLVLLAAIFARQITQLGVLERTLLAFFAFSLAASAIYVVNDIADREKDRLHPRKRLRPIAAGRLSVPLAICVAVVCTLGAAALTVALVLQEPSGTADVFAKWGGSAPLFVAALSSYVIINIAYSTYLKHQVLWDVFIIAAGFALRALAGAFAADVPISPWFYLCMTFGALFLALGKRRAELVALSDGAVDHRANLREYTLPLLDQLMTVMVTCTLLSYSLYTFQSETSSHALMITIPFVLFGVFRYLYLVYTKSEGERPDELLWRDPQILGAVVLCALAVVGVLYGLPLVRG